MDVNFRDSPQHVVPMAQNERDLRSFYSSDMPFRDEVSNVNLLVIRSLRARGMRRVMDEHEAT